jgi:hypothetical protein
MCSSFPFPAILMPIGLSMFVMSLLLSSSHWLTLGVCNTRLSLRVYPCVIEDDFLGGIRVFQENAHFSAAACMLFVSCTFFPCIRSTTIRRCCFLSVRYVLRILKQ